MLQNLFNQGNRSGDTTFGAMSQGELSALQKSLEAGYGSDMAALTGGSALRIQSLDTTMQATVQDSKHFTLFNLLAKPKATAVLDEWTEQSDIGGFFGGTFNTQDGPAMETNGDYARMVGQVKYMMTYRKVPIVLQTQNNIVDAITLETTNGTKQLLTDIEIGLFEGRSDVTPLAFPGIRQQIESLGKSNNIIDMAGAPLASIGPIAQAAETIYGYGSFGTATDIFLPPSIQTDLNMNLDPAFRIGLNDSAISTVRGTNVTGVQTSYGKISTRNDIFIRDEKLKKPFEVRNAAYLATAVANNTFKPGALTLSVPAADAQSAFLSSQAGNFYYYVTGINQFGESQGVVSAQVAIGSGQSVTLTIPPSPSQQETGYVIYRSRMNGTNQLNDLREMTRVPYVSGNATTTFVDRNHDIPGSTSAFILNLSPSDHAISWRQFMPMLKIAMAATNSPIIPWIQMICGYLRVTKRSQHVVIKNVVPTNAAWQPFGANSGG
jgi:hypothetical protein